MPAPVHHRAVVLRPRQAASASSSIVARYLSSNLSVDLARHPRLKMAWAGAKSIIIPPLVALAIYLACLYLLLPIYRRRQRYAQYLPVALTPSDEPGIVSRTRSRVRDALGSFAPFHGVWERRTSGNSVDFNFGDEELEEGMDSLHLDHPDAGGPPQADAERRLSRDLEVGFRDESEDEDDEDAARRSMIGVAR